VEGQAVTLPSPGSNFPPEGTVTIAINGNILRTVPTHSSGGLIFQLETGPTIDEGFYRVTGSGNPSAMTQFTLDVEDDVRSQEGSGTLDTPDPQGPDISSGHPSKSTSSIP
jgi:hypothetical protein